MRASLMGQSLLLTCTALLLTQATAETPECDFQDKAVKAQCNDLVKQILCVDDAVCGTKIKVDQNFKPEGGFVCDWTNFHLQGECIANFQGRPKVERPKTAPKEEAEDKLQIKEVDCAKLKVKQLKELLADVGGCNGCAEKSQFVETCEYWQKNEGEFEATRARHAKEESEARARDRAKKAKEAASQKRERTKEEQDMEDDWKNTARKLTDDYDKSGKTKGDQNAMTKGLEQALGSLLGQKMQKSKFSKNRFKGGEEKASSDIKMEF